MAVISIFIEYKTQLKAFLPPIPVISMKMFNPNEIIQMNKSVEINFLYSL